MGKRFSRLNAALKYLRNPTTNVAQDPPANSALAKYVEVKSGEKVIEVDRSADSKPKSFEVIAVKPFGLPTASEDKIETTISERTADGITAVGLSKANLGIDDDVTGALTLKGFQPAKAIVFDADGTTEANKVSGITGIKYNKKNGKSLTIPFGRASGRTSYFEQKSFLVGEIAAADTITFKPEKM